MRPGHLRRRCLTPDFLTASAREEGGAIETDNICGMTNSAKERLVRVPAGSPPVVALVLLAFITLGVGCGSGASSSGTGGSGTGSGGAHMSTGGTSGSGSGGNMSTGGATAGSGGAAGESHGATGGEGGRGGFADGMAGAPGGSRGGAGNGGRGGFAGGMGGAAGGSRGGAGGSAATGLDQACTKACAKQTTLACADANCHDDCLMQAAIMPTPGSTNTCETQFLALLNCESTLASNKWTCSTDEDVPEPAAGQCTPSACAWACCVSSLYTTSDIWARCEATCK